MSSLCLPCRRWARAGRRCARLSPSSSSSSSPSAVSFAPLSSSPFSSTPSSSQPPLPPPPSPAPPRYHDPYPLTLSQRMFLVPYYGLGALLDPTRGDLVAGLGDVTGERQLARIRGRLRSTAGGRKLLAEKPLISEASLRFDALRNLPDGTLGREYARYMTDHAFSADDRSPVKFIACPETAYVMARYRQVHDFWHVLCDLPPTVLGEVALKWYEWKLTGLPVAGFSSVLGPLKLSPPEARTLLTVYLPWVRQAQVSCEDLLAFRYEDNLHRTVDDLRDQLGIVQAPSIKR